MKIASRSPASFLRRLLMLPLLFSLLLLPLSAATDPLQPPGTEAHLYREVGAVSLPLFVSKPAGWKITDRRPAFVWFFGTGGRPTNGVGWATWATGLGLVSVTPDYREKTRFHTIRPDAIADARAVVRWLQDHAAELGIDPKQIVVAGNSAGGCLTLWTAITAPPPGSLASESPLVKPAALILTSGVSDTAQDTGYPNPLEFSPILHLDAQMPPVLLIHGDANKAVPYEMSVALHAKLAATGNACELILVPHGSHNYGGELPGWWPRTLELCREFLQDEGLVHK